MGTWRRGAARTLFTMLAVTAVCMCGAGSTLAATIELRVDTTVDSLDGTCGDSHCSLRDAVAVANTYSAGQQVDIILPAGHYYLNATALNDNEDLNASDDLDVTADIRLFVSAEAGQGPGSVAIFGRDAGTPSYRHRIFDVSGSASLTVQHVALARAYVSGAGHSGLGAAIRHRSSGNLHLAGVWAAGNDTVGETDGGGGAIFFGSELGGDLAIESSHFEGNSSGRSGGALFASGSPGGTATITNTTFYSNSAATGGAIFTDGPMELALTSSTLYQNNATGNGGAIFQHGPGTIRLLHSTIVSNESDSDDDNATASGAVHLNFNSGTLETRATLFSQNTDIQSSIATPASCARTGVVYIIYQHQGSSMFDDATGCGSVHATDVTTATSPQFAFATWRNYTAEASDGYQLAPGHLPIGAGSLAINRGIVGDCPTSDDIRGANRSAGESCDAGAYEYGARTDAGVSTTMLTPSPAAGQELTVRVRLSASGSEGLPPMRTTITPGLGVAIVSASVAGGTCNSSIPLVCVHPEVGPGSVSDATIIITASQGDRTLAAQHDYHPSDPVSANESSSATFTVGPALTTGGGAAGGETTTTVVVPRPTLGPFPRPIRHRSGVLRLPVACPAGVAPRCSFTGAIRSTRRVRGRWVTARCTTLTVAAGSQGQMICRIARSQRAAFPRTGGIRMRFSVTGRSGASVTGLASTIVRVRR